MTENESGTAAAALVGFERREELAKKFGMLEGAAAGGAIFEVTGSSVTAAGALAAAAPFSGVGGERKTGGVIVAAGKVGTGAEGSLTASDLATGSPESGVELVVMVDLVSENGRELIGGSFALVASCVIVTSLGKVNPGGISNTGAFLAASSNILCSAARPSSISSSSSSNTAENFFMRLDTGRSI